MCNKIKAALVICAVAFLMSAGTCGQTTLRGEIIPKKATMKPGESVSLELLVPPELDRIYRVSWFVEPENMGEITFKKYDPMKVEEVDGMPFFGKEDRKAVFTADQPGICEISTVGFYKQTNPQPIAKITMKIEKQ